MGGNKDRSLRRVRTLLLGGLTALGIVGTAQAGGGVAPRLLYTMHCSGCHLPDGTGAPEKGIPSMRGTVGNFLRLPEAARWSSRCRA